MRSQLPFQLQVGRVNFFRFHRKMDVPVLTIVYSILFAIVGGFFYVYLSSLLGIRRPFSIDNLFQLTAAGFFALIFIGSIVSWFAGCTFSLPTFGIEANRLNY